MDIRTVDENILFPNNDVMECETAPVSYCKTSHASNSSFFDLWNDDLFDSYVDDPDPQVMWDAVYDYDERLEALAPAERSKASDRLIPLGKWWHYWKRGRTQKGVSLRTYRQSKAMRKGRRFVIVGRTVSEPVGKARRTSISKVSE